jgi:hypothetical protein
MTGRERNLPAFLLFIYVNHCIAEHEYSTQHDTYIYERVNGDQVFRSLDFACNIGDKVQKVWRNN